MSCGKSHKNSNMCLESQVATDKYDEDAEFDLSTLQTNTARKACFERIGRHAEHLAEERWHARAPNKQESKEGRADRWKVAENRRHIDAVCGKDPLAVEAGSKHSRAVGAGSDAPEATRRCRLTRRRLRLHASRAQVGNSERPADARRWAARASVLCLLSHSSAQALQFERSLASASPNAWRWRVARAAE